MSELRTYEPRATFEPRATRVTGPKGLRGRRLHSNCVSSNRAQQLSQSVCIGVGCILPGNLILASLALQKYTTPMVNSKKLRATLFRYLWYLMYLVPEVPVVPVVPENLISDILVSPPFQKYITPMVNSENGDPCNTFQVPLLPDVPGT